MAMSIFDADTDMPSEPRDILPSFSTTKAMKQNLSKFQPPYDINLGYKTIKPISLPHNIYGLCPNTAKTASLGIFAFKLQSFSCAPKTNQSQDLLRIKVHYRVSHRLWIL